MVTHKLLLDHTQSLALTDISTPAFRDTIAIPLEPAIQVLLSGFRSAPPLDFLVGDELLAYNPPTTPESHPVQEPAHCYLLCNGRVRLLHQNAYWRRQSSATVLDVGDVFGADHRFYDRPLPYRAVATGPCRIIQLPYPQLAQLFDTHPFLPTYLRQRAQQREQLIFFKCFTEWRSHPSKTLKHLLLPHLAEQFVAAGTPLSQLSGDRPACFWLRSGRIRNLENPTAVPQMGDSWNDATPTPEGWIAQTDLILYKVRL